MDRRIQKTRQLIMNTFIDLLAEKGFEKITISDIAEHANINRGTSDPAEKCLKSRRYLWNQENR